MKISLQYHCPYAAVSHFKSFPILVDNRDIGLGFKWKTFQYNVAEIIFFINAQYVQIHL